MRGWMAAAVMGAALGGSAGGAAGCLAETFTCSQSSECGADGFCEFNGYCSFEDPKCDSGRRFGDLANQGVAGQCVPPAAGTTTGDTGSGTTGSTSGPVPTTTSVPDTTAGSSTSLGLTTASPSSSGTTFEPTSDPTLDPSTTSGDDTTEGMPIRVEEGVIALYRFAGGRGTTVPDVAPTGPPLDLTIAGAGYTWTGQGLAFVGEDGTIAEAMGSTTKINNACADSQAITLEGWVTPGTLQPIGPSRVFTYSMDTAVRNFTLGQGQSVNTPEHGWQARMRTVTTDDNGLPGLSSTEPVVVGQLTHLVYALDADGDETFYVDDTVASVGSRPGGFDNWVTDGTMSFAVGNEVTLDRPYEGEVHLVAVYCRALTADEVSQNYAAGF